jgi:drug/metabolite transporter (DMT)-like permease
MQEGQPHVTTPGRDDAPRAGGSRKATGRLLIVLAALMWSTAGFLAQAEAFDEWGEPAWRGTLLAFWRSFFAAAVLIPFIRRPRWDVRLVPMSASFAAMTVLYLSAITLTTAANAIWLQATAPIWVFLVSVFWFRESAAARDVLLLLFGMLGVGIILWHEVQGEELPGVVCGLLSGVTFGVVMLSLRRLRNEDAVWLIALNHSVTALVLLPVVIWRGGWPEMSQWPYLIALGVIQMGIPYILFARGVRSVASHEASMIALLEPVLLPVWVVLVLGFVPAWWTIAGGVLILSGLLLRYLPLPSPREP